MTVDVVGGSARVSVRDSGPGIAAADLPHVFDRFYQVAGGAGQPLGSGIGLALAHELASLYSGTLTAESHGPGPTGGPTGGSTGSTFTFSLPLGRAHLAPDQIGEGPWDGAVAPTEVVLAGPASAGDGAPHPAPRPTRAPSAEDFDDVTTLLVADDHADIRAYLRRHLEGAGYRVVEAEDGEAALASVRQRLPDLVVSDVMMPRLDGLGLCRALKADPETDFVPVLLLTAKASPQDRLDGLSELCDDYLTKPFDVRELVARVDNLIALRRRLRDRFGVWTTRGERGPGGDGTLHAAPVEPDSADAVLLAAVRDAVEAHLSDEAFSVDALAAAVGLSRGHLHRRLTELVGEAPGTVLRSMRLERAEALLAARAGTVSEVAYAVGFRSVAHFSNAFLAHAGCRPSVYAESREA